MHLSDGNPHLAIGHIEQSLTLHREAQDKAGECAGLLDLGQAQCLIGQGDAGEASLQAALKLAQVIQAPDGQAAAWAALAGRFSQTGQFSNAEAALQQAAGLYVQLREPFGLAAARINLAQIQIQRGQWPAAEENLKSLPSMIPPQLVATLQPSILAMQGQIAQLQGRLLDSLKLLQDASKGFEASGRGRLWRSAQIALSFLRIRLQQTDNLSEDLSSLISHAQTHNDPSTEADARLALAEYLRSQRRYDDALPLITTATSLLEKTGQRASIAATLSSHAETLLHQHPWHQPTPPNILSEIDALLSRAADLANSVGVPSRKAMIRIYLADLRRRQGRFAEASSLINQAITAAENLHFPSALGLAAQQRARLAWSTGDNDARITALNQAREVFTQMAALLDTQELLEDASIPMPQTLQ
jgi:tetratricopeptide (TPR) repeat protein